MIQINAVPDLDWTEESQREINRNPELVAESDFAWQIGDWFIAGWHYPVFAGPPWFWFAMTKDFAGMKLRRLQELQPRLPVNCHAAVLKGWTAGERFAKHFGFSPTGDEVTVEDELFLVYRRD